MGIYAGLTVHKQITNQRRYERVINEIIQLLAAHEDEVAVKIEPGKFITLEALYGSDVVCIPLSCGMLRSCFFRVHAGITPPDDVKSFACIIWEALNIFRENYPSKVDLAEENLSKCEPIFKNVSATEVVRRQLSCVISRKEESTMLMQEEMEDVWFVLYNVVKSKDWKSALSILDLLNSAKLCPIAVFSAARPADIRLLESFIEESENMEGRYTGLNEQCKQIATGLLYKIYEKYPEKAEECSVLQDFQTTTPQETHRSVTNSYEFPSTMSAVLFQAGETTSIDRVSFLLEKIGDAANIEELISLSWPEKLYTILSRFCDGVYGCEEHDVVRFGIFQYNFVRCLISLSTNPEHFQHLLSLNIFTRFFIVVEETCVFAFHLALNKEINESTKLFSFIDMALALGELAISPAFYKYLRGVLDGLYKLEQRILSFTIPSIPEMPGPSDPEALLTICPELHANLEKVKAMCNKLEALTEYQEPHSEKFERLFVKV